MTIGDGRSRRAEKEKQGALAKAFPKGIRCQKCLDHGHFSYQCKGQRKILMKPSRSQVLKKNMHLFSLIKGEGSCSKGSCKLPCNKNGRNGKKKKKVESSSSSSSSSDSDSSSSSSDSDSSSDDSDSGSESGHSDLSDDC